MLSKIKLYILLIIVIFGGFFLRTYALNWDNGFHLHPDERAIVMATIGLHMPHSLQEFLSPNSSWNPNFFAYGSFPMYLLKVLSFVPGYFDALFMGYEKINLLGRFLSALFDSATIWIVFLIGKKLFGKEIGFIGAFLYAITVLPIQLSHFYAVDTTLTFFMSATIYRLILLYEKVTAKNSLLVGVFLGLSLATKTSAIALILSIGFALSVDFFLIFIKQPHKPHIWTRHLTKFLKDLIISFVLIVLSIFVVFAIFEPYALLDFQNFWQQNLYQAAMTKSAYVFPYTLQYVNKIPYFYEIKNILLWGEGPVMGILSILGVFLVTFLAIKKHKLTFKEAESLGDHNLQSRKISPWAQELIVMIFFWSYFIVVGKFAVGWIRYMLPLYPLLSVCAATFIYKVSEKIKNSNLHTIYYAVIIISLIIWPISFLQIYNFPNTRVTATNWILQNIPFGKTLAIEHWDDSLPLINLESYRVETLELYNPDKPEKWQKINYQLQKTDYIIIASNRLYIPLQKLTDCKNLEPDRCYPITTNYYKSLFSGKLGFKKIAEFAVYPTIPILNIPINDQGADESFTVYDHPKVMIFKKESSETL